MKKNLIYCLIISVYIFSIQEIKSQSNDIYTPLNILKAYEKGTRSPEGIPGDNYWQNASQYVIKAELFPETRMVVGKTKITYFNNSPDSLSMIVMRLYQDILKKGNSRQVRFSEEDISEGMKVRSLTVNNQLMDPDDNKKIVRTRTNMIIYLDEKLLPGQRLCLEVKWEFIMTSGKNLRMGQYGENDFFIAYWYPQIAVYDDIDGWDLIEYAGAVEFYNDFSDFDVRITLPSDYVVWATGELKNADKLFHDGIYDNYQSALSSDSVIHIITSNDYLQNRVTQGRKSNTWKFIANDVMDFTFAASNRYNWDAASVEIKPGRRVLTSAVYPPEINYDEVAEFSGKTISYLSGELPGVPYPYPHITTFCNSNPGGGMESPMMANNGAPVNRGKLFELTFHEIAHTYFPFFTGINERKYGWMDEGWATFIPNESYNENINGSDYLSNIITRYEWFAGTELDIPPMTLSYMMNYPSIRIASYYRPAVAFFLLQDIMGKEKFREAFQDFIYSWQGKHPVPNDFFFTFERIYEEDLGWFWNSWFFEFGYADLALGDVVITNDIMEVTVERKGKLPVPVNLKVIFSDGSEKQIYKSAAVWKEDNDRLLFSFDHDKGIHSVLLGNEHIPDMYRENNLLEILE